MPPERSELATPELAVWLEPAVDVGERLGAQAVYPALRVDADFDESHIAQHAQVLRNGGLAHVERIHELADGALLLSQQVEQAPAIRLGDDLEDGGSHASNMPSQLYACQGIYTTKAALP